MQKLLAAIDDSISFGPTCVVWLIDHSPSASAWNGQLLEPAVEYYRRMPEEKQRRLQSVVWAFATSVTPLLDQPTDRAAEVADHLEQLGMVQEEQERPFHALGQALQKFLEVRTGQGHELLLVVITDEAGDDWQAVDELVEAVQRYATPVYVIGPPAPLGGHVPVYDAAHPLASQRREKSLTFGCDSRYPENIHLQLPGGRGPDTVVDSGFGPFGLQWLAQASGGEYWAVRDTGGPDNWQLDWLRAFDPSVMRRYAPDYIQESEYQSLLQGNKARLALHRAARLPLIPVLENPQLTFQKQSEAEMKRALDRAQQAAAKVEPKINELFEILREGLAERDSLTRPRWQAEFDLAIGRAAAAKVRVESYNLALAAMKRGRNFQKPDSQYWVLVPSQTIEGSSSLQRLADQAREWLERVVQDHPGTPWAALAAEELKVPMGWKWEEQ